ncbi:L-threonylcarbamoyladenylate synthase [Methanobrevibacter sp. DSM 116169]|uniref:L-threonylcarbamoyladenylate synthase n=1 Tax=Methanobrevibacter sp. DSM 116169 TaxID=3242727 RepID=UPI0038FCEAC7
MKKYKINPKNPDMKIINEAIEVLANGGIVLYPTDTVYGLGANIFNKEAVRKIYKIKNRSYDKPLSILVQDISTINLLAEIDEKTKEHISNYLPGPFTLILKKKSTIPNYITSHKDNVGLRIPDNNIARSLAQIFPITTTSANLSDDETLTNPNDILKQLNCDIDLVLDVGILDSKTPSKIIDLTSSKPKLLKRD